MSTIFIKEVLGWSLRDCLDQEKYASTISPLPNAFSSIGEWATSFDIACREEFRAQLQQSIVEATTSMDRIVQFEWLKYNPNAVKVRGQISSVKQVAEANSDGPSGSLHGAIGIFTRGKGYLVNQTTSLHFLCRVTVPKDDTPSQIVDVEFHSSCPGTEDFIETQSKGWHLFILDVMTIPVERMLDVLASFVNGESNGIFNEILGCIPSISDLNAVVASSHELSSPRWLFQMRNEHQQDAILRVLNATMGRSQNCVQIIHGPPGRPLELSLPSLHHHNNNPNAKVCIPCNILRYWKDCNVGGAA